MNDLVISIQGASKCTRVIWIEIIDFDISLCERLGGLCATALQILSILCGEVSDEEVGNSRLQLL